MRPIAVLALLGLGCLAVADERTSPSYYVLGFEGKAQLWLGSEDPRKGGGVGIGYGKPEPRFRWRSIPAQLVFEGYVDWTRSPGASHKPKNSTVGYGVLAISRWRWPVSRSGFGMYGEAGLGVQYATMETVDLDSRFNTTPVLGIGVTSRLGQGQELFLGARLLHISNGGTKGDNQGQNELFVTAMVRW